MEKINWIETQRNNSKLYKTRVDLITGELKNCDNKTDKDRLYNKLKAYPSGEIDTFIRCAKDIYRIIYTCNDFNTSRIRVLMYVMDITIGFGKYEVRWDDMKSKIKKMNINKASFYQSIKWLKDKNIINITNCNEDDKKNGLNTKEKIQFNRWFDTWKVNINYELVLEDIEIKGIEIKDKKTNGKKKYYKYPLPIKTTYIKGEIPVNDAPVNNDIEPINENISDEDELSDEDLCNQLDNL